MDTISFLLSIVAFAELSAFFVYGGFVSKETTDVYMNLDESKLRLNQFNSSILATPCYITHISFSILSKYHISGLGRIPRWSKLHKRVKQYFEIATKNSM